MAAEKMLPTNPYYQHNKQIWQYDDELSAAGNGSWVLIPPGIECITAILDSDGDGRIEVTNDTLANINADTVDTDLIVPWDNGDIGATQAQARIEPFMAIRQVNISGTTKMALKAQ